MSTKQKPRREIVAMFLSCALLLGSSVAPVEAADSAAFQAAPCPESPAPASLSCSPAPSPALPTQAARALPTGDSSALPAAPSPASPAPVPQPGDWPQWRGANRDGKSGETGLLKSWPEGGPPLLWKAEGAGSGYASVSVSSGRVFIMGSRDRDESVLALDVETGRKLWQARTGKAFSSDRGGGPRSTPTVDGDRLYALGAEGDLCCLSVADGKQVWHVNVLERFQGSRGKWGLAESVLLEGDKVVCSAGGKDASIVALSKATGDTLWTSKGLSDKAAYSSALAVTVGDLREIVNFTQSAAVGVSAKDGTPLWSYKRVANGVANCATPIVQGNRVFFTSDYDVGCALLELSPDGKAREVCFSEEFQNHHGGVILLDGRLYGHSGGNDENTHTFVCMDFQTGKVLWKDPGIGKCSITYAEGHLYALSQRGTMALVEVHPERFLVKSRFQFKTFKKFATSGLESDASERPTWAHPVVAAKRLFLRDQDSLCCYDIAQK